MKFALFPEDIIANKFILTLAKNPDKRFLSFAEIDEFAKQIVESLNRVNKQCFIYMNRDYSKKFLDEYKDFFMLGENGIHLNDNQDKHSLKKAFQGYLPYEIIRTIQSLAF